MKNNLGLQGQKMKQHIRSSSCSRSFSESPGCSLASGDFSIVICVHHVKELTRSHICTACTNVCWSCCVCHGWCCSVCHGRCRSVCHGGCCGCICHGGCCSCIGHGGGRHGNRRCCHRH